MDEICKCGRVIVQPPRQKCFICSPRDKRDRRRADVIALPLRDPDRRDSLTSASRKTLAAAGVLDTWQAEAALAVARLVDQGRHGASGIAANIRAQALGVSWQAASQRPKVEEEIPKLQHIVDLADPLILHMTVAAWKQLSGFQHGLMYAIVGGSAVSREFEIPGGALVRVTMRDQDFGNAMQQAALMQLWAVDTYIARTITQSS